MTDNNGASDTRIKYDAFGVETVLNPSPSGKGLSQFAGKHGYVTDPDSGLLLLGTRYYYPLLGRFLTLDPIGHQGGLNLRPKK